MALVFDYASAWAWDTQPQGRDFSYFRLMLEIYKGLRRLGLSVDMVPPIDRRPVGLTRLVLVPGMMSLTPELLGALSHYKGVALLGPRTNSKTAEFAIPLPLPPNLPGLDATIARVESLPPDVTVPLEQGGALRHWREKLEGGAKVIETAEDGWPALVAAGGLHYLGGWPDEVALDRILRRACAEAGVAVEPMPGSLRRRDSGGRRFYFNYGATPVSHAGVTIPAAGVHWTDA